MSQIILVVLFLIAVPLAGLSQKPEKLSERQRQEIEQAILKIENEWAQVIVSRDWSALERTLAPDFVGTDDWSVSNKAEEIASYKSSTDKVTSAVNANVKIHVFTKDTAVATGEVLEKGQDKDGKEFTNRWRWTDTYVRRNRIWQCVASQTTLLKQ
ncbi:MAG: nuclear transport factor 2 family protein [Acidobacteriota bacterium]|nr:nuclear transport factor 2 family protein [Acidobacteriota bacterium]